MSNITKRVQIARQTSIYAAANIPMKATTTTTTTVAAAAKAYHMEPASATWTLTAVHYNIVYVCVLYCTAFGDALPKRIRPFDGGSRVSNIVGDRSSLIRKTNIGLFCGPCCVVAIANGDCNTYVMYA